VSEGRLSAERPEQRLLTNTAREGLFIVDIALDPSHQMFDVLRRGHFRWTLEVFGVLPEIFESEAISFILESRTALSESTHTRRWPSSRDTTEASRTL
jgi:hypothetical protein